MHNLVLINYYNHTVIGKCSYHFFIQKSRLLWKWWINIMRHFGHLQWVRSMGHILVHVSMGLSDSAWCHFRTRPSGGHRDTMSR